MCSSLRWKLKNTKITENSSKWSKMAKMFKHQKVGPNVQFLKMETEKYKNC